MDYWIHIAGQNLLVVLDIAWWIIALRITKTAGWRALICLFMAPQLCAAILIARDVDLSLYVPTAALAGIMVWHYFGLPAITGVGVLYVCIQMMRRRRLQLGSALTPPMESSPSIVSAGIKTRNRDGLPAFQTIGRLFSLSPRERAGVRENRSNESVMRLRNEAPTISRRDFIGACAAIVPPLCTFSITGIAMGQLDKFRVRRFTLSLPSLPKQLDGLTIAHVSDVHVGEWTHGPVLKKIVDSTNALRADLVVVTGDLINYELSDLSESINLLKQMHGRYGLYMVEGNHDLIVNGAEFEQRVKRSGLSLLVDESVVHEVRGYPVQFMGLRWLDCVGAPNDQVTSWQVRELVKQRQPGAFPIFLAHHPHAFDAAIENGLPLTLTGHTHGGQLMLDKNLGIGPALFRYWSGFYKRGESQLIVSNGVGNMFPIRINAPAELVHITLKCA
jgi:predicted MPP superfamily phosphohydrolase